MIPTVVVVLSVLSSTLTLPITTQDDVTTGIEGVSQTQGEISLFQQVQKTGVEGTSEVNIQAQTNQVEKSTVHSGVPEGHTKVNNAQQIAQTEKTGNEVFSNVFVNPQHAAVPKVENVPVNLESVQTSHTENPVLLPVVHANQAVQVLQPVVVPVETIPAERMVIMAIDSIPQRNFQQDVSNVPEPYQQVVRPVIYTQVQTQNVEPNQQQNYVTPAEKPDEGYSPVRVQPNFSSIFKEQTIPVPQTAQQSVVPTSNHDQILAEPSAQVYSVQPNEQPVNTENTKKQASAGCSSTQFVEPSVQEQQQNYVQHSVEKQVPYQQSSIQNQANFIKPTGYENVEKQGPNQQYNAVQTQNVEQSYQQQQDYNTQQVVKNQVSYQQVNTYTPDQNQPDELSVYNVEPTVGEKTQKVGQYQESYSPVQIQSVEPQQQQIQSAQQTFEKQVPHQQPFSAQTYSVKPVNQQQAFSVQSPIAGQVENPTQYQKGNQFQNVGYSGFEPNQQVFNIQPQVETQVGGEKSQIQHNVHTQTSVPQSQDYSVQPPVGFAYK